MKYNFDEVIERRGTNSVKVDGMESLFGSNDLLPLWVADMDFRTPACVTDVIRRRCEQGVLGYTQKPQGWYESIIHWLKERHDWEVQKDEITFVGGLVAGLALITKCLTKPGDKILVQSPVYHPFTIVPENNGCQVVRNSLIYEHGELTIDFETFRESVKGCVFFVLCNPHNPFGRVWTQEELRQMAEICWEEKVLVISDEIHADLTLAPYRHVPFASVSEKARFNSITLMAPSKAFNMAGLSSSYYIISNEELRNRINHFIEGSELNYGHIFAFETTEAAYRQGGEWLDQVLHYIQHNINFVEAQLREFMPRIEMFRPQASFLVFLDCRKLGLSPDELNDLFVRKARLALNAGTMFGKEGAGFMRLNVACPRALLQQAMEQLRGAYETLY